MHAARDGQHAFLHALYKHVVGSGISKKRGYIFERHARLRKVWDDAYGGAEVVDMLRATGAGGRQRSLFRLGRVGAVGRGGGGAKGGRGDAVRNMMLAACVHGRCAGHDVVA